jgi:malate synthase
VTVSVGAIRAEWSAILSADALTFVTDLTRRFGDEISGLLAARTERQGRLDAGERLGFLEETRAVREGGWRVRPPPADLRDRRVEITGPTDRKMMINALNSGASTFMADLEDATSPTWDNVVQGQVNLHDAARRTIRFTAPETGKPYELADRTAVLMVRPRGLHLVERHLQIDGRPVPAALFDAGLFLFHNAAELVRRGTGPYLYLPKLESHREAALWEQILAYAERRLGLEPDTVRVTVLIETIPAAFEMDEILHALRTRIVALNCGRWDYIFSFVKRHREHPAFLLPDRGAVGMDREFLDAYARLAIRTCHRRGAHAIGGMAAQIPIKSDPEANARALAAVRADKEREVALGHDGTWVAHPGLVGLAREVFDAGMPGPNQVDRVPEDRPIDADALLAVPTGPRTEAGLRLNARVALQYVATWLDGTGCVPIDHRMEDAATAEISRIQLWQWVRHAATLDDGRTVTAALVSDAVAEEAVGLRGTVPDDRLEAAHRLVRELILDREPREFLTVAAYEVLTDSSHSPLQEAP